jgi:hypothetical protein
VQIAHVTELHPAEIAVEETDEISLRLFKAQKIQTALLIPYSTTVDTPDPVTVVRCPTRDERLTRDAIDNIVKTQVEKLDTEFIQKEKMLQDVIKMSGKKLLPVKPFDFGRWEYTTSAFRRMQSNPKLCDSLHIAGKSAFLLRESMVVSKSKGIRYFFVLQTRRRETPVRTWTNSCASSKNGSSSGSSSATPLGPFLEKTSCILCYNALIAADSNERARRAAELNIRPLPRDNSSASAAKNIITMTHRLRVDQCYTTRRVRNFPTPEAYHELTHLGSDCGSVNSPQPLPLPERPRVGGFSQENSVGWPGFEHIEFRMLESPGVTTDKLIKMVAHAFAKFVARSLLMEPVAEPAQADKPKLVSINKSHQSESVVRFDPALSRQGFNSFLSVHPTHQETYLIKALKKHTKWTIVKYSLDGLASKYTKVTERPSSTAYAHKVVAANLQQRAEMVAGARLQARLLRTELEALRAQRGRVAALRRLGVTRIEYSGDAHVGAARTPGMPGGSPHRGAWETRHAVYPARWHARTGLDDGQWEERPPHEITNGLAPQPCGFGELHATRTRVFCASPHGFARVHIEGAARCRPAPRNSSSNNNNNNNNSSSSSSRRSTRGSTLVRYRVMPYAARQFLSSLTTGPDTPPNGASGRYFADLSRGVIAANLALLRHCPRRVGRMDAKRWALRRNAETAKIVSGNNANYSDGNCQGIENYYDDDNINGSPVVLTRSSSLRPYGYGTTVPLLMPRAREINFAPVKINGERVQPAEVYAPIPATELVAHLKAHWGWL